jgi:pSer/pThr/pTyr-binding forkhead associated (FHA) protein
MICVLDILQGPASGKRIWLKVQQCIEVGRTAAADFSIPSDTHLSRRHFLLDSTGNCFRIRDVGSSNGTFLNDKRITVAELHPGDTIRAGLTTFQVSFREDDADPLEYEPMPVIPCEDEEPTDLLDTKAVRRSIQFPE